MTEIFGNDHLVLITLGRTGTKQLHDIGQEIRLETGQEDCGVFKCDASEIRIVVLVVSLAIFKGLRAFADFRKSRQRYSKTVVVKLCAEARSLNSRSETSRMASL